MSDIEPGKHFVITLIKGEDESPRDYVSRCNAIAAFARERSSTETPTAATSLDHFTQVSETSYQVITPGYQATGEQAPDRDTHFAGYAKLLLEKLKPDLALLLMEVNRNKPDAIEKAERIIAGVIATATYDFAFHVLASMPASKRAEYGDVPDCLEHVPDLTEWPEQSE